MAYIKSIALSNANNKLEQQTIKNFIIETCNIAPIFQTKMDSLYANSGIAFRHSVLNDFRIAKKQRTFFTGENISTEKRMEAFFGYALPLCENAICKIDLPITSYTHLITVSCTGMAAPGLELQLMEKLGFKNNTERYAINFMGCYAGFHAMKQAQAICALHPNAEVLIVDIELCSLHFQQKNDMQNIASTLLFADGCAAIHINNKQENALYQFDYFSSNVLFEGKKDMAWRIASSGFEMDLSVYIPSLLADNIKPLLASVIEDKEEIKYWAIHPGGKKILDSLKDVLELQEDDLRYSKSILNNYGNMSSVTIFYLLELIGAEQDAGKVFACGFGPGLSMEAALLKKL